MSIISRTIPGLYNGVSQQPAALRLDTQCSLQENASSDLVEGLVKRPGTEYVATLTSKADNKSFMHSINRDVNERYQVIITDDSTEPIEVFTIDGIKCIVNYGDAYKNYVIDSNPKQNLRAVTIADHTIIVNRTKTPEMEPVTDLPSVATSLGYVKRGFPEITYTIKVYTGGAPVSASYTTPAPSSQGVTTVKTDEIAENLTTQLQSTLNSDDWIIYSLGSVVVIRNRAITDLRIECFDSFGDLAMIAINGAVQKFSDLPPTAPHGCLVEISGDSTNNFDNYYVRYLADKGFWEETVREIDENGELLQNEIDWRTMPHRLVRTASHTFTLKRIQWEPRRVGDYESAPPPSFIGRTIKDVYFFKNRLGFLAGENVIMSRASEYFNFFPSTATDVLDSDPIDVAISSTRVAVLEHAVPFINSLLLFSDQQQFTASSTQGVLTPATIAIDSSTYFEASSKCAPVNAGPNLYFAVPSGKYSTIREYFVQPDTLNNDADDITAHVPRYLPSNIIKLTVSTSKDFIFALSEDVPNIIYVYKYFWQGESKVQSSWSKWIFDDDVLDIEVMDNWLYLVTKKEEQVHLVKLNLDASVETGNLDFRIHLDKMVEIQGTYNWIDDFTTFTLPYEDTSTNFNFICSETGNILTEIRRYRPNAFRVDGNWTSSTFYIGKTFIKRYVFSQFYMRNNQEIGISQGNLKLMNFTLLYQGTGSFDVIIKPTKRPEVKHEFTGVIVGTSKIGQPSVTSGERSFAIDCDSKHVEIELRSVSYLPCKIHLASYEAEWAPRAVKFY